MAAILFRTISLQKDRILPPCTVKLRRTNRVLSDGPVFRLNVLRPQSCPGVWERDSSPEIDVAASSDCFSTYLGCHLTALRLIRNGVFCSLHSLHLDVQPFRRALADPDLDSVVGRYCAGFFQRSPPSPTQSAHLESVHDGVPVINFGSRCDCLLAFWSRCLSLRPPDSSSPDVSPDSYAASLNRLTVL